MTIVTGNTLNLFAGGSVGTPQTPLLIGAIGTAPIVLNTSAKNGVYITQPSGNLTVGQVSTSSGTASLSTASGNILEGPSGAINAPEITLASAQGIGTSTLPLSVGIVGTAPELVNASAQQGIYITQPSGDLTVGQVTSTGGPVHLTATTGNIFTSQSSQSTIVAGGTGLSLWAGGGIGTATAPLLIDLTGNTAACVLNASAHSSIYVNNNGTLDVGTVDSATGDVVVDPSNPEDDLILGSSSNVSAPQGQVTLQAAQGDVMLSSGSVVNALKVRILGGSSNPGETGTGSQITLAGIINALSVDVVGGSGGDTVTVSQAGLNADLNVECGQGQNQFILQGAGGNNQFLVNGGSILLNGLRKIATSGIQTLDINGGAGDNLFQVLSTLAGTHSTLVGGGGSNTFWVGSNGTTGNGTLDGILGAIQVTDAGNGTGGSNELNIDDRGARNALGKLLSAGYIVTPTQVVSDPAPGLTARSTFAGISYDGTIGTLNLMGAQGGNGGYLVTPSRNTEYILDGLKTGNGTSTGDTLRLDIAGSIAAKLKNTTRGSGTWSFAGLFRQIKFSGMKLFNTVALKATASGAPVTTAGASVATFTVTFNGFTALDRAGLLGKLGAIRVQGPNGYSQTASFVSLTSSSDGNSQIATYSVPAPGGFWDRDDNGVYTIEVVPGMIQNSAGQALAGRVIGTFSVNINKANAFLCGSTLIVVGTSGPDTIQVTEANGRVTAAVNKKSWSFSSSQVNAIQVDGYGGNDVILLNTLGSNLPALVNEGSGNDLLWAGAGNATLIAGRGNDFLIGGGGVDRLYGGNGNDVLVSGQINPASPLNRPGELESLARQWAKSSTSSRFRTALTRTLKRAVQDDGSADQMFGGSGRNLFFKGKNAVVEDPTRRDVVIPVASLSGTGRSTVHVKHANPVKVKVATVKTAASRVVRVHR